MNILIAIVEDEESYAKELKRILEHWAKQTNCTICVLTLIPMTFPF